MGIPHREPSRRETRSENHTRPGQNGVLAIDGPRGVRYDDFGWWTIKMSPRSAFEEIS